jgi:hypothetical protein
MQQAQQQRGGWGVVEAVLCNVPDALQQSLGQGRVPQGSLDLNVPLLLRQEAAPSCTSEQKRDQQQPQPDDAAADIDQQQQWQPARADVLRLLSHVLPWRQLPIRDLNLSSMPVAAEGFRLLWRAAHQADSLLHNCSIEVASLRECGAVGGRSVFTAVLVHNYTRITHTHAHLRTCTYARSRQASCWLVCTLGGRSSWPGWT